jgi:hypothetical protein
MCFSTSAVQHFTVVHRSAQIKVFAVFLKGTWEFFWGIHAAAAAA